MRALMKTFDGLKRQFGVEHRNLPLLLPEPIQNLNIPGKVNGGLIRIPRKAMEDFFDYCIGDIVALIKQHVEWIGWQGDRLKNLFLAGGFGESEYLQFHIKTMLEQEGLHIKFRRPFDSWTAVVQGAVVCGIEKTNMQDLRRANSCRHSYAVCFDEDYNRMYHAGADMSRVRGKDIAAEQLKWILNKGDLVLANEPLKVEQNFELKLSASRKDIMIIPIYRNKEDEEGRPTRLSNARYEVETACELVIDLSKINFETNRRTGRILKPGFETIYTATLRIVLQLNWDRLDASVWRGKRLLVQSPVQYPLQQ